MSAIRLILVLLAYVSLACASGNPPPSRMLWVWESDTDLRFLKPAEAGVAWLGMTIYFDGTRPPVPEPRASSLLVSADLYQMLVVRLQPDLSSSRKPAWRTEQRKAAAAMILDLVRITRSRALQIDFDAPQSARPFYRELLGDVRRGLEPGVFLSMTALISWCSAPPTWLDGLAVDEIVPMDFDTTSAAPYADPACRQSIGLQRQWKDSSFSGRQRAADRIYLFNYGGWSSSTVEQVLGAVRQ
jgi:hypothetical protein